MELQTQNWQNFTANNVRDWQGIWTRYSPLGEVTESFRSLRSFYSDSNKIEIAQTNRYIYDDGNIKEQTWEFNLESNSLADGMFHPQNESMRGLFLASGHAAWVTRQLKIDSFLAVELFFRHENLRHSVGIVYNQEGALFRTANIREDETNFPSQFWSTDLQQVSERNLSGNWQGTSITITADLKISEPVPTKLNWG